MNPIKTLKQLKAAISAVQALPKIEGCDTSTSLHFLRPELVIGAMRAKLLPGAYFQLNNDHNGHGAYYLSLNHFGFHIALFSLEFAPESYYHKQFEILKDARTEN